MFITLCRSYYFPLFSDFHVHGFPWSSFRHSSSYPGQILHNSPHRRSFSSSKCPGVVFTFSESNPVPSQDMSPVQLLPWSRPPVSRVYIRTRTRREKDANVRCRHVTKARQTAFGCVTNVWRTVECYPSTVGTSKGIRVQYVYVGSIRCLGECRTIFKFTHMNVRIVFACRFRVRVPMYKPTFTVSVPISVSTTFPAPALSSDFDNLSRTSSNTRDLIQSTTADSDYRSKPAYWRRSAGILQAQFFLKLF